MFETVQSRSVISRAESVGQGFSGLGWLGRSIGNLMGSGRAMDLRHMEHQGRGLDLTTYSQSRMALDGGTHTNTLSRNNPTDGEHFEVGGVLVRDHPFPKAHVPPGHVQPCQVPQGSPGPSGQVPQVRCSRARFRKVRQVLQVRCSQVRCSRARFRKVRQVLQVRCRPGRCSRTWFRKVRQVLQARCRQVSCSRARFREVRPVLQVRCRQVRCSRARFPKVRQVLQVRCRLTRFRKVRRVLQVRCRQVRCSLTRFRKVRQVL